MVWTKTTCFLGTFFGRRHLPPLMETVLNYFHFLPPSITCNASSLLQKIEIFLTMLTMLHQITVFVHGKQIVKMHSFHVLHWYKTLVHNLWTRLLRLKLEILANIPAFSRPHLYLCICLKHYDLLLTCLVTIIVKAVIDGRQR